MLRQRRSPPGERGDPAGEKGTETLSSSPSPSSFSSRSPWFAVSTFGVADAPTLFKGLPHGAVDLSSDSSCHFVAFLSTEDNCAHAVSLRSVSAVDAAASLP
nr:hypothetical protein TGCOUG_202170B [Toxoplasma gondii COUG]